MGRPDLASVGHEKAPVVVGAGREQPWGSGGVAQLPAGVGDQLISAGANNGIQCVAQGNARFGQGQHDHGDGLIFAATGLGQAVVEGFGDLRAAGGTSGGGGNGLGGVAGHVWCWVVEGLPSDELIVARTVAVSRGLADQFTTRHIMKKPLG